MVKFRKYLLPLAGAALVLALAGCGGMASGPKTNRVVYLINGALGDNAFYDSGEAGIKNIESQYKVETRTIECNFDAGNSSPPCRRRSSTPTSSS